MGFSNWATQTAIRLPFCSCARRRLANRRKLCIMQHRQVSALRMLREITNTYLVFLLNVRCYFFYRCIHVCRLGEQKPIKSFYLPSPLQIILPIASLKSSAHNYLPDTALLSWENGSLITANSNFIATHSVYYYHNFFVLSP